ncbi:MAG: aromatic amino acid ammonia-lyase, partial [Bacteroidota bacterium]
MRMVQLDGRQLSYAEVIRIAFGMEKVEIRPAALLRVRESQAFIEDQVKANKVVYGVTTGFGPNADTVIAGKDAKILQRNLLISHAVGVGKPFSNAVVRAIMAIRLNTLLAGHSGVRPQTVKLLQTFLNEGIYPEIPEQGSVGASGDLCPLAHMALPLIGEGYLWYEGKRWRTREFLDSDAAKQVNARIAAENAAIQAQNEGLPAEKAQEKRPLLQELKVLELSYKEGLALNNGTTVMAALGIVGIYKANRLMKLAVLGGALAFEALCVRSHAFDPKVHEVRRNDSQKRLARQVKSMLTGSTFVNISAGCILFHTLQSADKQHPGFLTQLREEAAQVEIQHTSDESEVKNTLLDELDLLLKDCPDGNWQATFTKTLMHFILDRLPAQPKLGSWLSWRGLV